MINIIYENVLAVVFVYVNVLFNAIKLEDRKAVILDNSTLCGSCVSSQTGSYRFSKDKADDSEDFQNTEAYGFLVNKRIIRYCRLYLNY